MTSGIDEDDVLAGRATVTELCLRIAQALPAPSAPSPEWRVLTSWRHAEWFLEGSVGEEHRPGEWAILKQVDIASEATPEELKVWGLYGSGPFKPNGSIISCMAANEVDIHLSPDGERLFSNLDRDLLTGARSMLKSLESTGLGMQELYSDSEELAAQTASAETVRSRQKQLYEWFQGMGRTILLCRYGCPTSEDIPNRKFSLALRSGWIPVGYVGGFKAGVPVVFNPLRRG